MTEPDVDPQIQDLLQHSALHTFPEQVQGPYHRPVHPDRRNIVEDCVGLPLRLGVRLLTGRDRSPVAGIEVEVWQADKDGRYSGFGPSPFKAGDTVTSSTVPIEVVAPEESFLRGLQHTNHDGVCQFDTIYPGWYPSRTVHIHLIAHRSPQHHLITQLYFPDELTDTVFTRPPYAGRPERDTRNADDSIFVDGGQDNVLTLREDGQSMIGTLNLLVPQS